MLILVCLLALAGIKLKNYWEVCSEQQKRKKQGEIQQQEPARKVQEEILQQEPARKEPNIIQEQARKERDNQQKLIQKQQAILLAVERITKETDQWDRFISTATPNKPFINSIGIPFARVSGTRFLVSLKLISKTELAKAHDPSINDISSDENTWKEAVEFCTWLSYVETQNYHLPSNAEWEAIIKSGILEDNKESWIWSSETASLRDAFCSVGDVKVLRGYSFKYINRKETPDDVVIHCILAPKM